MSNPQRPFQGYAVAYDSLYQEKNYAAENHFIKSVAERFGELPVKSILDLGCGTGGHAIPLALEGYQVTGVDLSSEMLAQANVKAQQAGTGSRLSLIEGDISNISLDGQFDMIICMFAVLSYQTTNERLEETFSVVRQHLKPGGVFLCDFWYGPAVLRDLPTRRDKWVEDDDTRTHRVATPNIDFNSNVVHVTYDVTRYRGKEPVLRTSETHAMRYFFLPELSLLGRLHKLDMVHSCDCCNLSHAAGENTWTVSTVFKG
jgi:SAM-dependent methyltransferase